MLRRDLMLEVAEGQNMVSSDFYGLIGKLVEVHIVDFSKQIRNTDDTFVGRVQGWHVSDPTAKRGTAGEGSLTLDTYTVRWTRYQQVTIHELRPHELHPEEG